MAAEALIVEDAYQRGYAGGAEMQIIKGIAIAAVLIIAGLLALIVAAYLAFRIAAAIFEQQES